MGMHISFGNQTVTLVKVTHGTPNAMGITLIRTPTDVEGCMFSPVPLSANRGEDVTDTDVATEDWRCTAQPVLPMLAATAGDELMWQGRTYQIADVVGPHSDFGGELCSVTLICKRQTS